MGGEGIHRPLLFKVSNRHGPIPLPTDQIVDNGLLLLLVNLGSIANHPVHNNVPFFASPGHVKKSHRFRGGFPVFSRDQLPLHIGTARGWRVHPCRRWPRHRSPPPPQAASTSETSTITIITPKIFFFHFTPPHVPTNPSAQLT